MDQLLAPGVYVKEVPSAVKPIAGVGTSTAGFIGVAPGLRKSSTLHFDLGTGGRNKKTFDLPDTFPAEATAAACTVRIADDVVKAVEIDLEGGKVVFADAPDTGAQIALDYNQVGDAVEPALYTNFSQFEAAFAPPESGPFSANAAQNRLAHAVYGFFNNGGTRCWVAPVTAVTKTEVDKALDAFAAIDEIALVAAPGMMDQAVQTAVIDHCETLEDRFAILDGQQNPTELTPKAIKVTNLKNSNYAALYYPWIMVYDPVTGGSIAVPPSGHMAGLYARVDGQRGVHKAPANEVIRGALGVHKRLSRAAQAGLNPAGINVIRNFKGSITVWGARTLGGDDNGEWKYISVRRLFNFLRESIDEGTRWVVFEPNAPALWAGIRRNVSAFLHTVWASGALFGNTPQEAFFVRCDETTNPPEVREQGQVVTEIGVAVVKPAEFVVFKISQWAGPGE